MINAWCFRERAARGGEASERKSPKDPRPKTKSCRNGASQFGPILLAGASRNTTDAKLFNNDTQQKIPTTPAFKPQDAFELTQRATAESGFAISSTSRAQRTRAPVMPIQHFNSA